MINLEKAKYRYGFVLVNDLKLIENISVKGWKTENLPNQFHIVFDPDIKFYCIKVKSSWVALCGTYCMDVVACHMDMAIITDNLAKKLAVSEELFFEYLDDLNGRFACIYFSDGKLYVLNDAVAERSVYYSKTDVIVASHYNLIHEIVQTEEDSFWPKYCKWVETKKQQHKGWPWVMPGDRTPWENISILTPNHKLDVTNLKIERYYPRQNIPETDVESATSQIAEIIKNEAETLSRYYNIYQSLTAGSDTRISLAATKNIKDSIVYFTYHDKKLIHGSYESEDREANFHIAKKICDKENLKFKEIVIPSEPISNELKEVLSVNHYHKHIPQLLKPYSNMFTNNSIHLRSNLIEIIRGNEHTPLNKITAGVDIGAYFASINSYAEDYCDFKEVADIFNQYYCDNQFDNIYNYSLSQLFFWEYRLGVWLSGAVLAETDLVVDTFQLFNCRKILNIGLGMPAFYRNRSIIYDKILLKLWPELINYGLPNSSNTLYDYINKSEIKNGQIQFDKKIKTVSGNIDSSSTQPKFIFEPYQQGVTFGFSSNSINKGDFCGFVVEHKVEKDKNYFYQTQIKTSWMQGDTGGFCYELLINGNLVYKLSVNACYYINHIRYSFKAESDRINRVEIRVRAEKKVNDTVYNSTIDVRGLELKKEFGNREYNYQGFITDTYHTVEAKCKDLKYQNDLTPQKLDGANFAQVDKIINITNYNEFTSIEKLSITINDKGSIDKLNTLRQSLLYQSDKNILEDKNINLDIDTLNNVPEGRFSVNVHGIRFECLFHSKKAKSLYVILNGSKTATPPEFKRWSWYSVFEGDMLNIADPSYVYNEKLGLGWYYGTQEINYRELTALLIRKIAAIIGAQNIILYSSSGGAAAAIHIGGLIENSTVIAINPQIFLNLYHYAPHFKKVTGINLDTEDKWHRENGAYYILNSPKTKFLLVQNISNPDDFIQVQALERIMNKELKYGLNRFGNVGVWLYDIASKVPHNAQEDQIIYFAIDMLAKSLDREEDWNNLNSLYLIISEMWRKRLLTVETLNDKH